MRRAAGKRSPPDAAAARGSSARVTRLARAPATAKAALRHDAIQTAGFRLGLYALSLATGPLLARALGASGRGDLAAVLVPSQLFVYVMASGLPVAITYYRSRFSRNALTGGAWWFALVAALPLACLIWPVVPSYLSAHDPQTIPWLRAFLLAAVVSVPVAVSVQLVRLDGRTVRSNVLESLPLVSGAVAVVVLAATGRLTLSTALGASFVTNVASLLVSLVLARGLSWPRLPAAFASTILVYSAKVTSGTVASQVLARLDQLLLIGFVAPDQLGLYAVAVTAAGLSHAGAQGIGLVLLTKLGVSGAGPEAQRATARRARLLTIALSCAIAGSIALVAPYGLPALFGTDFTAAVPLLWVLLPGQMAADLATVRMQEFFAAGRPQVPTYALALSALATAISLVLAVQTYGVMGAAVSTTLGRGLLLLLLSAAAYHKPPFAAVPVVTQPPSSLG